VNALLQRRAMVAVTATLAAGLLVVALAGHYVVRKYLWAQGVLAEVEPRFARLLGLRDTGAQLDLALKDARRAVARLGYLPDRDAAQVGNDLQQLVRRGLTQAGATVGSSQVLPVRREKGLDRIPVAVQAESALSQLQLVLVALQSETPAIAVDGLVLQPLGRFADDGSPMVSYRLTVAALRLQS
jgi:general secretion pathway protein M